MRRLAAALLVMFSVIGLWAETPGAIQSKRVAMFYDDQFPWHQGMAKDRLAREWYQEKLTSLGLQVTTLDANELIDATLVNRRKFDTVFLPGGSTLPLGAETTLTDFLVDGGNLVVGDLLQAVFTKITKNGTNAWTRVYGQDYYHKHSEWQLIRVQSLGAKGVRRLNVPLTRSETLPESLQSRLPQTLGAFSNVSYTVLDRVHANIDIGDGYQEPLVGGNILWPIYLRPDGEGADFVGYRYHNLMLNGPTLVVLGSLGNSLLHTASASNVLYTAFKLGELPFPGEQNTAYYQRLFKMQQDISRLSEQFITVSTALADAATVAFYQGKSTRYAELKDQLVRIENEFFALLADKQNVDDMLTTNKSPEQQHTMRKELLARMDEMDGRLQALAKKTHQETSAIRRPESVAVENKQFDRLRFDAGATAPIGPYMFRTHFFQALKKLGVNTVNAADSLPYYLRDPLILKNSEGLAFSPYFGAGNWNYTIFDQRNGQILLKYVEKKDEETESDPLDNASIIEKMPAFIEQWKCVPIYRYYYSDALVSENGMSTFFWGKKARLAYQAHLTKKYQSIQNLNKRWTSQYASFADIPLTTNQPRTEIEHGNWEDWATFRDEIYTHKRQGYYETSKKLAPTTPVSFVISTACMGRPFFGGNNLYLYSKYQDITGVDGTFSSVPEGEWAWFDLNRGIPFYTVEWGPFYHPNPNPKGWRNQLTEEIWALLSGGSIGINCYVWSMPGYRGNMVDIMGQPTLAGWHLKSVIEQANQIDHILLDGRRGAECLFLYSNTCRRHDQVWFGSSATKHHDAVNKLYDMFLRWHRPARVLAEEALEDGYDLSSCRMLLVPQADYLKDSTQEKLLAYVRSGGNLLVEGESGKFDNYGHPSGKLLAAGNIICRPTSSELAIVSGEEMPLISSENEYRIEVGKGSDAKTLIEYADKTAAVVSCRLGKGHLIVSGIPFGLLKMNDGARQIMDAVNSELGLTSKYECNDQRLKLREWIYKGQTFLICTYPYVHDNKMNPCSVKIQGTYKVQDYLLGMEVPSRTDAKETVARFLMPVPGVRVFRLDPLSAEQLAQLKPERKLDDQPAEPPSDSQSAQTRLPYAGMVYEGRPLEIEGYTIEVIVIRDGEADIVIGAGGDTVRRRIYTGLTWQTTVGGKTLSFVCKEIRATLPVGAMLDMRASGDARLESACSFKQTGDGQTGDRLMIQNGIIGIEVDLSRGGRVPTFVLNRDGINQVAIDQGTKVGITERINGGFPSLPCRFEVVSNTADTVVIQLASQEKVKDLSLRKRIAIKRDEAAWSQLVEATYVGKTEAPVELRVHPQLSVGGSSDYADSFYVSVSGAVRAVCNTKSVSVVPSEGWAGIVDRSRSLAYIQQFPKNEVSSALMWTGMNCSAMELFQTTSMVKPGQKLTLSTRFMLIPGVSALDAVFDDMALALTVGHTRDKQELSVKVELGSAALAPKTVALELSLLKDGIKALEIGKWSGAVSFENPAKQAFAAPLSALAGTGHYTVRLTIADSKGTVLGTLVKAVPDKSGDSAAIDDAKEATGQPDKTLAGAWRFNNGFGEMSADLSTFGNEAKIIAGKWIKKNGNSLMLDGSNAYVDCGAGESLDISGPITIAAWIHPLSAKGSTIVARGKQYWLWCSYGGLQYYYWGKNSNAWVTWIGSWKNGGITPYQWNHIVLAHDFISAPRMYLNGVASLAVTGNTKGTDGKAAPAKMEANASKGTKDHMYIGRFGEGKGHAVFKGIIGPVAIYTTCWKEEDVARYYSETAKTYQ